MFNLECGIEKEVVEFFKSFLVKETFHDSRFEFVFNDAGLFLL